MFVTCLIVSHNKPKYVCDTINSVYNQTFQDWQAIVIDSGVLYDSGYFDHLPVMKDKRFQLIRSWETAEIRRTKIAHSWCVNECFKRKLIQSEFVCYSCDDDILYANAFQTFFDFYKHNNVDAMYASMDFVGHPFIKELRAYVNRGSFCGGPLLSCQVDGGQVCHKVRLLDQFPTDKYWPEELRWRQAADGCFLDRLGTITTVHPIDVKIGCNRKVPESLSNQAL